MLPSFKSFQNLVKVKKALDLQIVTKIFRLTLVVQKELSVRPRRPILSIELADSDNIIMSQNILALFISFHDRVLGRRCRLLGPVEHAWHQRCLRIRTHTAAERARYAALGQMHVGSS